MSSSLFCVDATRRTAFGLVDLVASLIVVVLVAALGLPALQAGREAARRKTCSNSFKQVGLAIHNYHSAHRFIPMHGTGPTNEFNDDCCSAAIQPGKFPNAVAFTRHQLSFLVGILPFCEQQALWDRISDPREDQNGHFWPAFGPAPYTAIYEPWNADIPTYRCPSDPGAGAPSLGRTNIAACVGDSMWRTDNQSWSYFKGSRWRYNGSNRLRRQQVNIAVRGFFVPRRSMRFRDVLDGLSNTIAAGEIATHLGDLDSRTSGSTNNGRDHVLGNPKFCFDNGQLDAMKPTFWIGDYQEGKGPTLTDDLTGRGYRWADFRPLYSQVNTILPPNSEVCLRGTHSQDGVTPPSSRHGDGAHILMGDGAVIFITDSIEAGDPRSPVIYQHDDSGSLALSKSPYGLWGALGSRSSAEMIEESG